MRYKSRIIVILAAVVLFATGMYANSDTVRWESFEKAFAKTIENNDKPMIAYFFTDYCGNCRQIENKTFTDSHIVSTLNDSFYASSIDLKSFEKIEWRGKEIAERKLAQVFRIRGVPTVAFLDTAGEYVAKVPGYIPPNKFDKLLKFVSRGWYEDMSFREFMKSEALLKKEKQNNEK